MELDIHREIYSKLEYYINIKKIPNIIFHGPSGCGKRILVNNFILKIYNNNKDIIKSHVMYVNCAHGKGIKFIREELKFFSKTYANTDLFKSVILSNADKLTIDAQSALRRCIELFSNNNTRFFIIIEDKYKLLKPILSRFCEIYIPLPIINNKYTNINTYHIKNTYSFKNTISDNFLKKILNKLNTIENINIHNLIPICIYVYENGYSAINLINYIEKNNISDEIKKYKLLMIIDKIKSEFRNEKLLILFILNFIFIDNIITDNISFI